MKNKNILLAIAITGTLLGCSTNKQQSHTHFNGADSATQTGQEPRFLTRPFAENLRSLFDTDKATLRTSAKNKLDSLLDRLESASKEGILTKENPLTIVGHTDSRASRKYNKELSQRRAQSVANYLIKNGVPKNFITVSGKGELQPIATNKTKKGMQLNRRVVINVTGDAIQMVEN